MRKLGQIIDRLREKYGEDYVSKILDFSKPLTPLATTIPTTPFTPQPSIKGWVEQLVNYFKSWGVIQWGLLGLGIILIHDLKRSKNKRWIL